MPEDQPGFVEFRARLAAGAHLFSGSSLNLAKPTLSMFNPGASPGNPDLAVVRTGAPQAAPGELLNYSVTYTNQITIGITAIGVQVSDSLPVGMTYVGGSASHGGSAVGNTITWDLGDCRPAPQALTYKVQVASNIMVNTSLVNDAQIQSSQDDLTPSDNLASFVTTIVPNPQPIANDDTYAMPDNSTLAIAPLRVLSNDTEPPPESDLAVFKSVSSLIHEVGSQILYTLTATNLGPDDATEVVLFSPLPTGMDFGATTNGVFTNGAVGFSRGDLLAGASTSVTVSLTPTTVGFITNTTTISSAIYDPFPPNHTASAAVTVRALPAIVLRVAPRGVLESPHRASASASAPGSLHR